MRLTRQNERMKICGVRAISSIHHSVAILVNMAKCRLLILEGKHSPHHPPQIGPSIRRRAFQDTDEHESTLLAIVSRVDIQKRQSTDQQSIDAGSYIPSNESRAEKRANHGASTTRMMLF
ncbi:uncharacterized protein P174DRAFT_14975 [Aspergillus novofumigatus IBT 16806]|uniref:Uncharacterized protein n=1 Tax=Aspergillus novofumigatus (strain IBT 16806) TaxID=1392255 RepID=A0A2I1CL74_ASPN1|nr:uncharacterized protein P174DRAFT_14975 [Aspergillus novofumigatus IBT 16806]PKX98377.1 hypothetical protein P174DRAFT_14975 [Aspergillus novofumigatus IBT 16806]